MDPVSLSSLGAVGVGYAVKFLFDRASAVLDRRAQRNAAEAALPPTTSGTPHNSTKPGGTGQAADAVEAERELADAMRVLQVYRTHDLPVKADDEQLMNCLGRMHAALEQVEGAPIDLTAHVQAMIEVEQTADVVRGDMTGARVDALQPDTTARIRQQIGSVEHGGTVIGFQSGRSL